MYQGAMPQAPQRMEVQVPHIEAVPLRGEQVDAAIERGLRVTEELAELHDLGVQQRQELALKELEARRNEDFQRRSEVWGGEGSFYNEDGTTNRNAVDEFKQKWRDENDKIARPFWLSRNRAAGQARHDEVAQKIGLGLDVDLAAQERKNIAAVWQDNYQLELARGNHGVCMGMIDEAVGKGLLRPSEGRLMKYRLCRARACGGGGGRGGRGGDGARIGVDNLEAALEAERMPEPGVAEVAHEGGAVTLPGGDLDAEGAMPAVLPDDSKGKAESAERLPEGGEPSGVLSTGAETAGGIEDFTEWDDARALTIGLRTLNADEFQRAMMISSMETDALVAGRGDDGRVFVEAPAGSPETVARISWEASERGGLTLDEYREMCYSLCRAVVSDPSLAGLGDEKLKAYMVGRMRVDELSGELFGGEQDPAAAYESLLGGIADACIITKSEGKEMETAARATLEAAVRDGAYSPDAVGLYYEEAGGFSDVEDSMWQGNREEVARRMLPEYVKYRERFAAETGAEIGERASDELTSRKNNIKAFREWYYKKGGVYDQKRAAFVAHNTDYLVQKMTEAVVQHRRRGGTWAEEEAVRQKALKDGVAEVRETRGKAWEKWEEKREANARYDAEAGRAEFEGKHRERLERLQEEGKAKALAREAKEEAQASEKKRREKEEREAAEKAENDERKRAEGRGYELSKYYNSKAYRVCYKKFRIDTKGKSEEEVQRLEEREKTIAAVTVPAAMYAEMLKELGASARGGIVCYFGSGREPYPVRAGDVGVIELNVAAVKARHGQTPNQATVRKVANGYVENLKFRAY